MAGDQHLGRPVRDEHHHALGGQSAAEIVEEIDRGDVGPVQILEEQHQWLDARDLGQQRAQLALHPLLRRALHVITDLLGRGALGRQRRDLHEPDRSDLPHHPVERIGRPSMKQVVQRLEHRQVGFSAGEPL